MLRKKSQMSPGFAWIYGLVIIFGLGLLYIVFNQVFVAHLVPVIKGQVNDTYMRGAIEYSDVVVINEGIDKYMSFFHIMPFILFFVVVIFMFVTAIRKEGESSYR